MNWETKLIKLYFLVCKNSDEVSSSTQRFSPNDKPTFSDEELTIIFLYCIKKRIS